MKRLLAVLSLIVWLSLPAYAGHTVAGDFCQCGSAGCVCEPGEPMTFNQVVNSQQTTFSDLGTELLIALAALTALLRIRN